MVLKCFVTRISEGLISLRVGGKFPGVKPPRSYSLLDISKFSLCFYKVIKKERWHIILKQ